MMFTSPDDRIQSTLPLPPQQICNSDNGESCILTLSFPTGQYLQVLLAVKHNALGLYFSVFNVHLVAAEDDGNALTDTNQITVPVGYVLVSDS